MTIKPNIRDKRIAIHDELLTKQIDKNSLLFAYEELDTLFLRYINEIEQEHKKKHRLIFYKKKV